MRFGVVEGHIVEQDGQLRLTVTLESGKQFDVVREGIVALQPADDTPAALDWLADQYTQETIGVDLAEGGWEVVAESAGEPLDALERPLGIGKSRRYVVRRPLDPWGSGNA